MLLDLIFGRRPKGETPPAPPPLLVGGRAVTLHLVRHPRARRYLLRLLADGSARVTIPRGGSAEEARRFAGRQTAWLETQWQRLQARPTVKTNWEIGGQILFRGETHTLHRPTPGVVQFGSEVIHAGTGDGLQAVIEEHLRRLAERELPPRVRALAREHQVEIRRVSIRNQRTRWGSCSRHGTISLNWRLIQTPAFVSDYVILHELMHRRQLNHSFRFWREVASVCPAYKLAESWLKQHAALLR